MAKSRGLDNDKPDAVLSYLRTVGDEQVLTVVNLSDTGKEVRVRLPGSAHPSLDTLLADGAKIVDSRGDLAVNLVGSGYFVGELGSN